MMRNLINLIEAPKKFVQDFTEGYCYALAIELNNRYHWPLSVIADEDEDYTTIHAFVVLPDGRGFDINGPQSLDDMLASYAGGEEGWRIIGVDRPNLLRLLNPELKRMTLASSGYAQQAILQYLKPLYRDVFALKEDAENQFIPATQAPRPR